MASCRQCLRGAWGLVCLLTIEPAFFLVSIGSALSDAVTKVLLYDKVCIAMTGDIYACVKRNLTGYDLTSIQQQASYWDFYQWVSLGVPAILSNVLYATLTDRWSKKYTILFFPTGAIISSAVYIVSAVYIDWSPAFLLLGSLVAGLSGSLLTLIGACFSYLSATVPEASLIVRISVAEAVLLASRSIAFIASGVFLEACGFVVVYIACIPFYVLTILYVLVRLKNIPPVATNEEPPGNSSDGISASPEAALLSDETNEADRKITQAERSATHESPSSAAEPSETTDIGSSQKILSAKEFQTPAAAAAAAISINSDVEEPDDSVVPCDPSPSDEESLIRRNPDHSEVSPSRESCSSCSNNVLCSYFRDYVGTVTRRRELGKRSAIIAILSIIFVEIICDHAADSGLSYLFVIQKPLSWSASYYGYYTGTIRIVKGVCFLVILPLAKKMNIPYAVIIIVSLTSSIVGHTVFSLSLYTWMAFLSAVLNLFGSASIVTARSFIVRFINEDEHGKTFGIISSLETVATLSSAAMFNLGIYPATVKVFSGLAILIAALLLLVPLSIAIWLHIFVRNMIRISSNRPTQSQDSVENQR